jgi:DNA-binding HxlR family transcriptional regulator
MIGPPPDEQAPFPSQRCRAREVLDRVGDKWSVYVITLLGGGTRRFSELKREIGFITQRMLTVTLRGLERDGLVTRTVHATAPVRVDYQLTPLGESLLQTLKALLAWSVTNVDQISEARQRYDRSKAKSEPIDH